MIILIGILVIGIILGSVWGSLSLVDYINDKFDKDFDYQPFVYSVLIVECMIALQILSNQII